MGTEQADEQPGTQTCHRTREGQWRPLSERVRPSIAPRATRCWPKRSNCAGISSGSPSSAASCRRAAKSRRPTRSSARTDRPRSPTCSATSRRWSSTTTCMARSANSPARCARRCSARGMARCRTSSSALRSRSSHDRRSNGWSRSSAPRLAPPAALLRHHRRVQPRLSRHHQGGRRRCSVQCLHPPRRHDPPLLGRRDGLCHRRSWTGSARRTGPDADLDHSRLHARRTRQGLVSEAQLPGLDRRPQHSRNACNINGVKHAKDRPLPLVRRQRRRGRELLRLDLPELDDRPRGALGRRLGRARRRQERQGAGDRLHHRRPRLQGAQWRPALQVQRGGVVLRRVQGPGGGRHVLGQADRGRRRAFAMRLAQGQVRPVVADRAGAADGADDRSGCGQGRHA